MTTQDQLREDAEQFEREDARLTSLIEEAEERIVELRRKRDDVRFHRAEARLTADFLDRQGWRVERDAAGVITVSVDPAVPA
jgi:hypothetical protein